MNSSDVNYDLTTRCGYVALVGRPNVGKSTLMNHMLGQKISITSRKPQTTRQQILGIHTEADTQIIFVDTPGLHLSETKAINKFMNRTASSAIKDVDAVIFLVDRLKWTAEDEYVLTQLMNAHCPVILAINKVDKVDNKEELLPHIEKLSQMRQFAQVIPVSALKGHNVDKLLTLLTDMVPKSLHYYPEDQVTDRSERFLAAELIREKIMRQLGAELPYDIAVEIEQWQFEGRILHLHAAILVARKGQKRIVIGDKGDRIKAIGTDARLEMERLFETQIMLNLWVKVKGGWSDDERALKSLGYSE